MQKPAHILVLRFSAMGDVAMTVPVLRELLQQYPSLEITVVSQEVFQPFFKGIDRLHFLGVNLKTFKGLTGLLRLFNTLRQIKGITAVADLHAVIRTHFLANLFRVTGMPVAVINKGRKEKKELVRKEQKVFRKLTTTHERYARVFAKLGFPVQLSHALHKVQLALPGSFVLNDKKIIVIAPFAKHREKMYPPGRMKVAAMQLSKDGYRVLLLGGGEMETNMLQEWEDEQTGLENISGMYSLAGELAIMSHAELLISMDSANMHLASIVGTPVVSVWGATHHFAGFMGYGQRESLIVETDLSCRPCSVFGNKPCWRGDHACIMQIEPGEILEKVDKHFNA